MQYEFLDERLLKKPGVTRDFKVEWDATRFMVDGKMFVMVGENKEKQPIISIKVDPVWGETLRNAYADIVPGYYLNKQHWVSVTRGGAVPDTLMCELLDSAYDIIVSSLPKKRQAELKA